MDRDFIVYCNNEPLASFKREIEAIEQAQMLFHEGHSCKVVEQRRLEKTLHEFGGASWATP